MIAPPHHPWHPCNPIPLQAGWFVVEAQWYSLQLESRRGYKLEPKKELLIVNTMLRLKGLSFESSTKGPQQRDLRPRSTGRYAQMGCRAQGGLFFLSEDTHNVILGACDPGDSEELSPAQIQQLEAEAAAEAAELEGEAAAAAMLEAEQGL